MLSNYRHTKFYNNNNGDNMKVSKIIVIKIKSLQN